MKVKIPNIKIPDIKIPDVNLDTILDGAKGIKVQNKNTPDIQVMMLGARRVGKTCVLASMVNQFNEVSKETNLSLTKSSGAKAIDEALTSMKGYFNGKHGIYETVILDTTQTMGFDQFDLELTIVGKTNLKPRKIRFVDCSGEWINNYTNTEDIAEKVEYSDVIIIAIDSVLLMEENGKYNAQNCVENVTNFIKQNMNPDENINNQKMILFVPIKCEKYYHQNEDEKSSIYYHKRVKQLNDKIKESYSDLLGFLCKPNIKKSFTVAITPVLTLGGIEFDEFNPVGDKKVLTTEDIKYCYCKPLKYEPEYCEQPLLYTLMYEQHKIEKLYAEKAYIAGDKNKKRIMATIIEWLQDKRGWAKDRDYIAELEKMKPKVKKNEHGFEIIQDPLGML